MNGILYIAGEFTYLGPNTGSGGLIDAVTGGVNTNFPRVSSTISKVVSDGSGGWYIAGAFNTVGGISRIGLAHILSNGSVDPTFVPSSVFSVLDMALAGTTLYLAGSFTEINGVTRNRIGAVDAATGALTAWNPNSNAMVRSIAWDGGNILYVGGDFTTIGGASRNRLAALDRTVNTNNALAWNPNADDRVDTIAFAETTLYAGGRFSAVGGQSRSLLAGLRLSDGTATTWNPSVGGPGNPEVENLAIDATNVYFEGLFDTVGGQNRSGLAALSRKTGLPTPWNPAAANGSIEEIRIDGTTLTVVGGFTSIAGQARLRLAAFDTTTGTLTAWKPNAGERVDTVAFYNNQVYVGGNFSSVGGVPRNNLAAIDITTGVATEFDPNANGQVLALAASPTTIYAGGQFTTVSGLSRNYIAALDPVTGQATSWNPNANFAPVLALAVSGNTVYVGGGFSNIGGASRSNIAALNALVDTNNATAWNPTANSGVSALLVSGTTVYAGGLFTSIGGAGRNRIAALDATINVNNATAWNPNANNDVKTLALAGSVLYAGGNFTTIGGAARNRIAALDTTINTNNATAWDPNANNFVYALAVSGSFLFTGGWHSTIGGASRIGVAELDRTINTNNATAWVPSPKPVNPISGLWAAGPAVFVGGSFNRDCGGLASYGTTATQAAPPGGAGNWSQTGTWNTGIVPNGTAATAEIRGASTVVTQDIVAGVDMAAISVVEGAVLAISGGDLRINSSAGLQNIGTVVLNTGRTLTAMTSTTIHGVGPLQMASSTSTINVSGASTVLTNSAGHTIAGRGTISARLTNLGTVRADVSGATMSVSGSSAKINNGLFEATNGAILRTSNNANVTGSGVYRANGGTLRLLNATQITGERLEGLASGIVEAQGTSALTITGLVALKDNATYQGTAGAASVLNCDSLDITVGSPGGHLNLRDGMEVHVGTDARIHGCGYPGLRGCTPPTLAMANSSTMTIGGDLNLEGDVGFVIADDAYIEIAGDFNNFATNPTLFDCDAGQIVFLGPEPQRCELPGADLGPRNPAGFVNNFAFDGIALDILTDVTFSNAFANTGGTGCEVLYVNLLELDSGSTLRVDGCQVYYTAFNNLGGTVVVMNGGALMSTSAGDLDNNGSVTTADMNALINLLVGGTCSPMPTCAQRADLNGDGVINSRDIPYMVRVMVGW